MEYYVVWRNKDGGIESDVITINEKITSVSIVVNAVRNTLAYWKQCEYLQIISWQPLEE